MNTDATIDSYSTKQLHTTVVMETVTNPFAQLLEAL